MIEDENQRISEIVREIRVAHEQGAPADEVFRLIRKFYSTNEYRREVQDVALLTIIAELEALKRAPGDEGGSSRLVTFSGGFGR